MILIVNFKPKPISLQAIILSSYTIIKAYTIHNNKLLKTDNSQIFIIINNILTFYV